MDAFIGDRGIKSYAGVLKKDNKLFYNFIRVKVAEGKNCVDAIYARKAIVSNGCLRNDFFSFGEYNFIAFVTNGKIYCDLKNFFNERFGIASMSYEDVANQMHDEVENYIRKTFTDCYVDTDIKETGTAEAKYEFVFGKKRHMFNNIWCCTIKVDIENSKGQYIEKDKQEATKDGSESTKIQHGI